MCAGDGEKRVRDLCALRCVGQRATCEVSRWSMVLDAVGDSMVCVCGGWVAAGAEAEYK